MKTNLLSTLGVLSISAFQALSAEKESPLPDLALQPPQVITNIGPDHVKRARESQGDPAIERTGKGRLWAARAAPILANRGCVSLSPHLRDASE